MALFKKKDEQDDFVVFDTAGAEPVTVELSPVEVGAAAVRQASSDKEHTLSRLYATNKRGGVGATCVGCKWSISHASDKDEIREAFYKHLAKLERLTEEREADDG